MGKANVLVRLGLAIYALTLLTSFMHVWEAYSKFGSEFPFVEPVWVALGVAVGLDLSALYYSYVAVLTGSRLARTASLLSVLLVWFAVVTSMLHLPEGLPLTQALVGLVLSSFVPVSNLFMGKVLGELAKHSAEAEKPERYVTSDEAAYLLGVPKDVLIRDYRAGKLDGMRLKRINGIWYWCLDDLEDIYAQVRDSEQRTASEPAQEAAGSA
ncbi:hypothetical protein phiFa_03 [Thermus phage phiFa]|nr:hypothetical protein phiFa_03 [Thermus phage phiFa]